MIRVIRGIWVDICKKNRPVHILIGAIRREWREMNQLKKYPGEEKLIRYKSLVFGAIG